MKRLHRAVLAFEDDGRVAVLKCGHRRGPAMVGGRVDGPPGQGKCLFCRVCSDMPRVRLRTPCGTKQGYCKNGCRCRPCKDAYACWVRTRRAAKRAAQGGRHAAQGTRPAQEDRPGHDQVH